MNPSAYRLEASGLRVGDADPIDFALAPGQCLGLSGPSGAGKTQLLRAIADLDAHAGECRLDGVAADAMPGHVWRRRVAYVAADSAWWDDSVGPHLPGVSEAQLQTLDFGLDVLDWPVARLSSGERQRLALLRHLVPRPAALLLDEPTAHLDPRSAGAAVALLQDYRQREGAALLWVDHDRDRLIRVADIRATVEPGGVFSRW